MAWNEKEIVGAVKPEDIPVNILFINGSPRAKNNTQKAMDVAMEAAGKIPGVNIDTYHFHGKKMEFCRHCPDKCINDGQCMFKDGFQEFAEKWLWADGVVWACPVYHMGPPAKVRAVLDRLSEVGFHTVREYQKKKGGPLVYARYTKAVGAIIHGATRYGGQEITMQFFMNHAVLQDNFYVTGDMPECYLGAAGQSPNPEAIPNDKSFLHSAATVGQRVTEMAKIIKASFCLATDSIPESFFASKVDVEGYSREEFKQRIAAE